MILLLRTWSVAVQKDEVVIDKMFRWERSAENGVMAERQSRKKGEILARAGTRVGPVSPPCQAEPYTHRSQTTTSFSFISHAFKVSTSITVLIYITRLTVWARSGSRTFFAHTEPPMPALGLQPPSLHLSMDNVDGMKTHVMLFGADFDLCFTSPQLA